MTNEQRIEIRDKIFSACKQFTGQLKTKIYKKDGEIKQKKDSCIADTITYMGSPENGTLVNKGEDVGRAVIYNQDASFQIVVHDIDHMELTFKKNKTSVTDTVKEFHNIHKKLE